MLDNLKLGSTTSSIILTPADTTIASNFTLPQLTTSGTDQYDLPRAYGPVPGDTGVGATNYGYFYNWSAATAGETRTTMPGDGTNGDIAPYSICPLNWRLPIGGVWNSGEGEFADLDRMFGGTGLSVYSGEPNVAFWLYTGTFKGTLAGSWDDGGDFTSQDEWTSFQSASATRGWPNDANYLGLTDTDVYPGGTLARIRGQSVRCLHA